MTRLLVDAGSNPNFQDSLMQSIIFYICRDGKQRCFEYLLEKKVDVDKPDVYGQTPLYYACRDNRLSMARKLIELGANVNRTDSIKSQTPLFYAAREGHLEICKLLVERGANITLVDSDNKTAVQYARKFNKAEVLEYLSN
jgi:ankyrin repeat protein